MKDETGNHPIDISYVGYVSKYGFSEDAIDSVQVLYMVKDQYFSAGPQYKGVKPHHKVIVPALVDLENERVYHPDNMLGQEAERLLRPERISKKGI